MPKTCTSNERLNDIRCCNCNKKLGEIKMQSGVVEIDCSRCGTTNTLVAAIDIQPEGQPKESYSVKVQSPGA